MFLLSQVLSSRSMLIKLSNHNVGSECPAREPHSQLIRVKVFLHEPGRCRTESSASSTKIDVAIFLFGQEISRRLQYDVGDASSSYARKSSDRSLQSTATSSITSRGATDVSISSSGAGGRKRRKATDDQDGESEDDGSRNYRRRSKTPSSTPSEPLKLACPFFKHSPAQFRMTHSCTGPFSTVHRVKYALFHNQLTIMLSGLYLLTFTNLESTSIAVIGTYTARAVTRRSLLSSIGESI